MSYEYLYSRPDRLKEKPFDAGELMGMVMKAGFNPITLSVDNGKGSVVVCFTGELGDKEKKALDGIMTDIFKGW
jgi:hypothetical protein